MFHVPEDWQPFGLGLGKDCTPAGHILSRAGVLLDLSDLVVRHHALAEVAALLQSIHQAQL